MAEFKYEALDQSGKAVSGSVSGSVAWGDYNNDGFLDLATIDGSGNLVVIPNNFLILSLVPVP